MTQPTPCPFALAQRNLLRDRQLPATRRADDAPSVIKRIIAAGPASTDAQLNEASERGLAALWRSLKLRNLADDGEMNPPSGGYAYDSAVGAMAGGGREISDEENAYMDAIIDASEV